MSQVPVGTVPPSACVAVGLGTSTLGSTLDPRAETVDAEQALLQLLGQCRRAFLRAATGAVAQSVAAAGIEVGLPPVRVWPF